MRSVNKVVIMGHLATDPEPRNLENGQMITRFRVATNRDWKSSNGEKHEATDYHRIVTWNKLAEICGKYLKKGAAIYIEGRLMNRSFLDKESVKRSFTEIVADAINFISYKKSRDAEQINLVEMPV